MTTENQDRTHIYFAALMFTFLVERVKVGEKRIKYSHLAGAVGYPPALRENDFNIHIGETLWWLGTLLEECKGKFPDAPRIQALVVSKKANVPGSKFSTFCEGYAEMSHEQKEGVVAEEEQKAAAYDKWESLAAEYNARTLERLKQCAN